MLLNKETKPKCHLNEFLDVFQEIFIHLPESNKIQNKTLSYYWKMIKKNNLNIKILHWRSIINYTGFTKINFGSEARMGIAVFLLIWVCWIQIYK